MLITSSKMKVMFKNLLTKKTEMKTFSSKISLRREEERKRERTKKETEETKARRWTLIT